MKRRQSRDVQVHQSAVSFPRRTTMDPIHNATVAFIARVLVAHSDRMTCDIETPDKQTLKNVPVMTKAGLVDGEHYGEMDLPAEDDYVIVISASYGANHEVIIGTFIPYLANEFGRDAVGSANKQFTLKVLEADVPLEYRRIFKAGVSVQIEEDGTITVEAPSGRYVKVDEANGAIHIEDPDGNAVELASSGISMTDANGNTVSMESGKVVINGNLEVLQ